MFIQSDISTQGTVIIKGLRGLNPFNIY